MANKDAQAPQTPGGRRYIRVSATQEEKGGRRRKGAKALVNVNGDVTLYKSAGDRLLKVVKGCRFDPTDFTVDYGYDVSTKSVSVHPHKALEPGAVKPTLSTDGYYQFNVDNVFRLAPELRPVVRVLCDVTVDTETEDGLPCLVILLDTGVEKRVIKRGPRKKKSEKEQRKSEPTDSAEPEDEADDEDQEEDEPDEADENPAN